MRRLALVIVAGLALAACGGGSKPASTTARHDPAAEAKIRDAYARFFSDNTTVPDRVRLLENGSGFEPVVFKFTNNPLAVRAHATVSSVTLQSPSKAEVVYQIHYATTSLPQQTGTAVKQGGQWKVGDATLCQLMALRGSTPSVCKT